MTMEKIDSMRESWLDPIDEPEDTRPQCPHCNEHFDDNSASDWCSNAHWHLDNIGAVKKQILSCFNLDYTAEKIIMTMDKFDWFAWMTASTVGRWKRAITTRYEQDAAIIAQANELENYNDGY